jgi:sugar phosphate isomerase/epimerase
MPHLTLSRRRFAGLICAVAARPAFGAPPPPHVTGVELYTVHAQLKKDPDATLKVLAAIGFRDVEGYSRPESIALAPKLKQYGLTLRSCQVEAPLITNNWEPYPELNPLSLAEAIDGVAAAGAEYFTMGYIAPGARGDGDDFFRRTADRMNAAAELCRRSGLKFAWQNHAFEFAGAPGMRPIDIYRERLDPKLAGMELDVFWAGVAGQDAVRLLKEWKGRVPLVRLADKTKGFPRRFEEAVEEGAFAEIGSGEIDFPAVLKAAAAAGTKYYFIAPDRTEGDPLAALPRALALLNR